MDLFVTVERGLRDGAVVLSMAAALAVGAACALVAPPYKLIALDSAYLECLCDCAIRIAGTTAWVLIVYKIAIRMPDNKRVAVALPQLGLDEALQHLALETDAVTRRNALPLHDDVLDPEDEDAPVQQVLNIVLVVHILRVELLEDLHQ